MTDDKFKPLYIAVNELMADVGVKGEIMIHTSHPKVDAIMNALYDIDEGVYDVERVFGVTHE